MNRDGNRTKITTHSTFKGVNMRKYIIFLTVVLWSISFTSISQAHEGGGWSTWTPVTWHDDYILVHHKHTANGTTCELYDKFGNDIRFRLVSLNANNRDCTG